MKPFSVARAELSQTSAWWVHGNSFSLHNDYGLKFISLYHDQPFSFKIPMKPFSLGTFQKSLYGLVMGIIVFTYIFWVEVCIIGDHYSHIYQIPRGHAVFRKLCVVYVFMGLQFTWYMYVAK